MNRILRLGVFLETRPHDGGAHQHNINVVEALARFPTDRFEVVAAYRGAHWEEILRSLRIAGVPLRLGTGTDFLVKCVRFGLLPLAAWHGVVARMNPASSTMRRQTCDFWIYPAQDDWTYLGPRPALGTIHDLMHRYEPTFPEVSAGAKFARRERHYRRLCGAATVILVDSEAGKRQVMESYGVPGDRVCPLPFIAPRYVLDADQASDLPTGLPPKFFFYPAQFWEHKNHQRLLEALALVRGQAADVRLVLVGSKKNNYARVERLIDELGLRDSVVMLGYVDNRLMGALYRRARALVMPTFFGPTNIPPLEAFACGCPVAVSDIYGMREQVGDAALLFDPKSVPEIAAALSRLWTDDAFHAEMARRSRAAGGLWGIRQFSDRLLEIIDNLARARPSRAAD